MMLADQVNIALSQPKMPPGLRWVSDPYRLRDTIRKAKHFRLDAGGSRKVAEVSLAIAEHLDEAMARCGVGCGYAIMNVAMKSSGASCAKRRSGIRSTGDD